jgi:hypothetical protein
MSRFALASVLLLTVALVASDRDKELQARLRKATEKLEKRKAASVSPDRAVLHDQATALLEAARRESQSAYRMGRLLEAADDLLEASEEVQKASGKPAGDQDPSQQRQRTARRLERAYFRIQQADYFARQSRNPAGPQLTRQTRQYYQQARAAYDQQQYSRASHLASACFEIVSALEDMAQAEVQIPEPPRLD